MWDAVLSRLLAWVSFGTDKFQGPAKRRILMTNILVMLVTALCVPHILFFLAYDASALRIPIIFVALVAIAFQLTRYSTRFGPMVAGFIIWCSGLGLQGPCRGCSRPNRPFTSTS